jgi:hypothetical protein
MYMEVGEAKPNPECPDCQALLKRVDALEKELGKLKALLEQNSLNSNRPACSQMNAHQARSIASQQTWKNR